MHIKQPRQLPGDDFTNLAYARLPDSHRLLMGALRLLADVGGVGEVDLHRIRRETWQAGEEGAHWPSIDDVETYLLELAEANFLQLYRDPLGSGTELFHITATWPRPQKQGYPKWQPPHSQTPPAPPQKTGMILPFRKAVVGGEGESAGERASGRESFSGNPPRSNLNLTPSSFCSLHPGGPLEGVDCRDCGTARMRRIEYQETRAALVQADTLPRLLRQPVIAQLEAKLVALEEAATQALFPQPVEEDPVEFIDDEGRIDSK